MSGSSVQVDLSALRCNAATFVKSCLRLRRAVSQRRSAPV